MVTEPSASQQRVIPELFPYLRVCDTLEGIGYYIFMSTLLGTNQFDQGYAFTFFCPLCNNPGAGSSHRLYKDVEKSSKNGKIQCLFSVDKVLGEYSPQIQTSNRRITARETLNILYSYL